MLQRQADGVGTAMESRNNIGLTLHPAGIVRRPAERRVEERLVRLAEAADVDDDDLLAGQGEVAKAHAETPGRVVVEAWEAELGFLTCNDGEVFGESHF